MTDQPDQRAMFETLARAGRQMIRDIWARRDERDELAPPEARILRTLERHKQYRAYWEGAEPTDEENPFLLVTLTDMVEKQIDAGDPPQARATLERLQSEGMTEPGAKERILEVLAVELYRMIQDKGTFDKQRYIETLDKISASDDADPGNGDSK